MLCQEAKAFALKEVEASAGGNLQFSFAENVRRGDRASFGMSFCL